MSDSQGDLLWQDPEHAVSSLLHVVSANLGGDLVVWLTVDNATGVVTLVALADPVVPAEMLADLLRRSGAMSPNSLSARLAELGQPLLVANFDLADYSLDSLPAPWPEYLAAHPINGLIAVPIRIDETSTGVLVAARRTTSSAYTSEDLRFVVSGALRVIGRPVSAPQADDTDAVGRVVVRWIARQRRRLRPRELLLGAGLPVLTTAVLASMNDSTKYLPGVLLLLGCVVAAVVAGV
ncbi:MAG: GAF domain-containing protein, partial [Ilumatobacteraceae bacterium]